MKPVKFLTITEQVAEHLGAQIRSGVLRGTLPGRNQLAAQLGINYKTVQDAMRLLENAGLLKSQGAGRNRRIVPPRGGARKPGTRVAILLWDVADRSWSLTVELKHRMERAGFVVVVPAKTLQELNMDVQRVARLVKRTKADAWIVIAASRQVLEWFSRQKFPAFAIYGRHKDLPMAAIGGSFSRIPIITRNLIELGHRRIVLLLRQQHILPVPGATTVAFLETLRAHGIADSEFNLPVWEESKEGFQACLRALFQVTPPTAIIVDEDVMFLALTYFLVSRGIRVPRDVSVVCLAGSLDFHWCDPMIAHFSEDLTKLTNPILRWARNVGSGKKDIRQHSINLEYVAGGTVGPAPGRA